MLPDFLGVNIDSPLPLRILEKKRFEKHCLRRNHGWCEFVDLKKNGAVLWKNTLQQSLLLRFRESQVLIFCLNMVNDQCEVSSICPIHFYSSLCHAAFCCQRLVCMDNINRAAITSGFLSLISQWERCLARDEGKKKSEVRIFIFLAPSLQGYFRLTFPSVESHCSSQVGLQ